MGQNTDVGALVIPLDSDDLAEALLMVSFINFEFLPYVTQVLAPHRTAEITTAWCTRS